MARQLGLQKRTMDQRAQKEVRLRSQPERWHLLHEPIRFFSLLRPRQHLSCQPGLQKLMDRSNLRSVGIQSSEDKGKIERRLLFYPLPGKPKETLWEALLKIKILDFLAGGEERQGAGYWKLLQGQARQHFRSHSRCGRVYHHIQDPMEAVGNA